MVGLCSGRCRLLFTVHPDSLPGPRPFRRTHSAPRTTVGLQEGSLPPSHSESLTFFYATPTFPPPSPGLGSLCHGDLEPFPSLDQEGTSGVLPGRDRDGTEIGSFRVQPEGRGLDTLHSAKREDPNPSETLSGPSVSVFHPTVPHGLDPSPTSPTPRQRPRPLAHGSEPSPTLTVKVPVPKSDPSPISRPPPLPPLPTCWCSYMSHADSTCELLPLVPFVRGV